MRPSGETRDRDDAVAADLASALGAADAGRHAARYATIAASLGVEASAVRAAFEAVRPSRAAAAA